MSTRTTSFYATRVVAWLGYLLLLIGSICLMVGGVLREAGFFIFGAGGVTLIIVLFMRTLSTGRIPIILSAERLAERRRTIAWHKGIPRIIWHFYFEYVRHYSSWLKHSTDYFIPSLIHQVDHFPDGRIFLTTTTGGEYTFWFHEERFEVDPGKFHTHGRLEIFDGAKKVCSIHLSEERHKEISSWKPIELDEFISGRWLRDFLRMYKEHRREHKRDTRES